jgi:3-oxoacyl-[acyl-carrier protein] reductase
VNNLAEKHILITGASSGIGRDAAILLSQLGAKLTIVGRNSERLSETLQLLTSPTQHMAVALDLNSGNLEESLSASNSQMGKYTGLVHAAGIHAFTPLHPLNMNKVEQLIQTNITTTFKLLKFVLKKQNVESGASLVLLSSVVGFVGQPSVSAYAASKGAILALVKSAAVELARQNIRVNAIAPGVVQTEMTQNLIDSMTDEQFQKIKDMHPLGLGNARDISNAIAFLLSDSSRWITGTTLVVDGGYSAS